MRAFLVFRKKQHQYTPGLWQPKHTELNITACTAQQAVTQHLNQPPAQEGTPEHTQGDTGLVCGPYLQCHVPFCLQTCWVKVLLSPAAGHFPPAGDCANRRLLCFRQSLWVNSKSEPEATETPLQLHLSERAESSFTASLLLAELSGQEPPASEQHQRAGRQKRPPSPRQLPAKSTSAPSSAGL